MRHGRVQGAWPGTGSHVLPVLWCTVPASLGVPRRHRTVYRTVDVTVRNGHVDHDGFDVSSMWQWDGISHEGSRRRVDGHGDG